jgi:5-methylthioribose kinase
MQQPLELVDTNGPAIEAHCRSLGWITPDEHMQGLGKAGDGNMNRTFRVTTERRTFILKQSVPWVARYPHIPAPVDRIDVENRFYTTIAGDGPLSMRMPVRFGFDPRDHLLALEDVGTAGDMLSLYGRKLGEEQGRGVFTALVYWLWRLHALPGVPADGFANTAMRELNHAHIFVIPLEHNNGAAIDPGLTAIADQWASDEPLKTTARNLGDIYLGRAAHASRLCLLHGDYYPGSWLFHQRMGAMIIDPEFAFVGAPEFDVGVFVAHLTFAGFTQADIMGTLRSYVTPPGFDYTLAIRFAAMEIIRRLLGVAQLPLQASVEQRINWLNTARMMIGT